MHKLDRDGGARLSEREVERPRTHEECNGDGVSG